MFTLEELYNAMLLLQLGPGIDEFYRTFWDIVGDDFFMCCTPLTLVSFHLLVERLLQC